MIRVKFDPSALGAPAQQWWQEWQTKARAATLDAIAEWETKGSIEFDQKIWSELKEWLLENVFRRKCAYCETRIVRASGDAEHFRPKARVAVKVTSGGKAVKEIVRVKDVDGTDRTHPGYFWLAYDPNNLLPSCEGCNRRRGKLDQFPAMKSHVFRLRMTPAERNGLRAPPLESPGQAGVFYPMAEDLNRLEEPDLLHPYFDEPHEHLRFGDLGIEYVVHGSRRGAASIETYDLRDADLRRKRQAAQYQSKTNYLLRLVPAPLDEVKKVTEAFVADLQAGSAYVGSDEYAAASTDYINDLRSKLAP